MEWNIVSYGIYFAITVYIILAVGKICYQNGNIFVLELIPDHAELCHQINKMLLMGYYLINIGYAAITLISWPQINNWNAMIVTLSSKTSLIIGILAFLHYLNIYIIANYIHKLIK